MRIEIDNGAIMIGERLKEMRQQKKLTQKQVQELTQIDQSDISKFEIGKRKPSLQQLAKLARLYETSMDYLTGETDVKTPYPPAKPVE